jgi:hypothetical protein
VKQFITKLAKDLLGQSWTVLGLVVAWLVLEGSAKEVAGNLILFTLLVWIITFPLRNKSDD